MGWRRKAKKAARKRRKADADQAVADAEAADQKAQSDLINGTSSQDQDQVDGMSNEIAAADDQNYETIEGYESHSPVEAMIAYNQKFGDCLEYDLKAFQNYAHSKAEYAERDDLISPYTDAASELGGIASTFIGHFQRENPDFNRQSYENAENYFFGLIKRKDGKGGKDSKGGKGGSDNKESEGSEHHDHKGMLMIVIAIMAIVGVTKYLKWW